MIIVSGGTGLIGSHIVNNLISSNREVIVISRDKRKAKYFKGATFLEWTEILEEKWVEKIRTENEKVIVNLTGENIGKPWTKSTKRKILESRLDSTRTIVELAKRIEAQKLINASAIGFYGNTGDSEVDEKSPPGDMFLSQVCYMWEDEAKKYDKDVYILRIGVVLERRAKIITSAITPFFILNSFGKGQNYISWIHIKDLTKIILNAIDGTFEDKDQEKDKKTFIINCVSPNPVRASEFIKTISEIKKRKVINVPQFILEIIFGKDFVDETVRVSQRVRPTFLLEKGFDFSFPTIREALEDILK